MTKAKPKPEEELKIEWRSPASLIPYIHNSKLHTSEQIDKLASVFIEHGFDQPIVVDEKGVILKGHGRREGAIKAAMPLVPVVVREGLTEVQKKALRISDNKLAESPWIPEMLALDLEFLKGENFDLDLTGFPTEEINAILSQFDEGGTEQQGGQFFGLGGEGYIPPDNKDIDEEELAKTKHKCPKCEYEW